MTLRRIEIVAILTEEAEKLGIDKPEFHGNDSRLFQACMRRVFEYGLEEARANYHGKAPSDVYLAKMRFLLAPLIELAEVLDELDPLDEDDREYVEDAKKFLAHLGNEVADG